MANYPRLDEDVKGLREAPRRLRLLADWLDAKFPDDSDPEIQADLRHWAEDIDRLVIINDDLIRRLGRIDAPEWPNQ